MMKQKIRSSDCPVWLAVIAFWIAGCDVETVPGTVTPPPNVDHLVINEVYTLPGSEPNAHSWIEIYNPGSKTVSLKKWSLNFRTTRLSQRAIVYYSYDTVARPPFRLPLPVDFNRFGFFANFDSVPTVRDVPIARLVDSIEVNIYPRVGPPTFAKIADSSDDVLLAPGEFLTLVSDISRLRVYNTLGPGNGPPPDSSPFLPLDGDFQASGIYAYRLSTLFRDSLNPRLQIPDTLFGAQYLFFLQSTDQIILKDSTGSAVDVVRYGNYVYAGSGTDPYSSNVSIGTVPAFESIVRYAGGYDTDNSVNDFYITRPGLRPIPHWISQSTKP